jgi:hypothetical protein
VSRLASRADGPVAKRHAWQAGPADSLVAESCSSEAAGERIGATSG